MSKSGHRRYLELGGIINENDFESALDRMGPERDHEGSQRASVSYGVGSALDRKEPSVRASISQAIGIAEYAGIELSGPEDGFDPRVVLYVILRSDVRPEGVKYHHSQMSDQRIFGEVLRMLEDAASLDKLIRAYPNISFKYETGE